MIQQNSGCQTQSIQMTRQHMSQPTKPSKAALTAHLKIATPDSQANRTANKSGWSLPSPQKNGIYTGCLNSKIKMQEMVLGFSFLQGGTQEAALTWRQTSFTLALTVLLVGFWQPFEMSSVENSFQTAQTVLYVQWRSSRQIYKKSMPFLWKTAERKCACSWD